MQDYHFEPHGQIGVDIKNIHESMKNIFKLWIKDIREIAFEHQVDDYLASILYVSKA